MATRKNLTKIDALPWKVKHLKAVAYIRGFIDTSLYNNFNDETDPDVMCKKIGTMFETNNALNRVSVFRKILRLRYQDGSSMAAISEEVSAL